MKHLITLILIWIQSAFGQNIEFYGGPSSNIPLAWGTPGYYPNKGKVELGYRLGATTTFYIKEYPVKIGFSFLDYRGEFKSGAWSSAGGFVYKIDYWNYAINIDLYPLNFNLWKKLEFNVGFNFARRVYSEMNGTYTRADIQGNYYSKKLTNEKGQKSSGGILLNMCYPIHLGNGFSVVPQFHSNFFIIADYHEFRKWTNMIGIGLRQELNFSKQH